MNRSQPGTSGKLATEAVIFALPGQFLASIGVFAYVHAENWAGARDKAREAVRAGFSALAPSSNTGLGGWRIA